MIRHMNVGADWVSCCSRFCGLAVVPTGCTERRGIGGGNSEFTKHGNLESLKVTTRGIVSYVRYSSRGYLPYRPGFRNWGFYDQDSWCLFNLTVLYI